MTILGSSPPFPARPVSIAVRDYLRTHVAVDEAESALGSAPRGVVVGVSGGADSLALGLAAAEYAQHARIPILLATVDHSMREESDEEARAVRDQLLDAGVLDARVLKAEPATNARPLEGRAREVRHALLEELAMEWGAENGLASVDILVGHTMDDQAETVLMRLGRGASPRALSAMRPRTKISHVGRRRRDANGHRDANGKRDPNEGTNTGESRSANEGAPKLFRGRPLLSLRRADTEGFCRALGLSWVEDPTNTLDGSWTTAAGQPLVRSALRHTTIPHLGQALGQDPVPPLARVAAMLAADEDALAHYAQSALEQADEREHDAGHAQREADGTGPGDGDEGEAESALVLKLNVTTLAQFPLAVRTRVYLLAWEKVTGGARQERSRARLVHPTSTQIAAVDALVTRDVGGRLSPVGKEVSLPAVRVVRSRWQLTFTAT